MTTAGPSPQSAATSTVAASQLRYRRRYLRCEVPPADRRRLTDAISRLPAALSGQFHNLDLKQLKGVRHRGLFRLRVGDYRVIFWPIEDEIVVLEVDRKDDTTYDHLDRLVFHRHGEGLHVTEVPEQAPRDERNVAGREPTRRSVEPDRENPLTVFTTPRLQAVGLEPTAIKTLRTFAATIEIGEALAEIGVPPAVIELVADMWHDPARYLTVFDEGRTPAAEDARIDDAELAARLRSPASSEAAAELDSRDFELVLRGSIEDWMFYMHPSQARIVVHAANGPSRVRGGPGTGKTVAALHRARHLVRVGLAESVLLTTFVSVLPSVWTMLLERFAPDEAPNITARTVDNLAFAIVAGADGEPAFLEDDERRKLLEELVRKIAGLHDAI